MGRRVRRWRVAAVVVAALSLVTCGIVVSSVVAPQSQVAEATTATPPVRPVAPIAPFLSFHLARTDGQLLSPNKSNYAEHAATPGPLLLFLPATGADPLDYRAFFSVAVKAGFDVLGLDYWNRGRSVVGTCGDRAECYTSVQRNRFDGSHPSAVSNVDPANSILNRLRMALTHLTIVDPAGKWDRYLTDGRVDWSRIVVAGHSQGGGESAYISHLHLVQGVLMFSSPVETNEGVPAAWMREPGETPASRMYGFVDRHDEFETKITGSWKALGLASGGPSAIAAVPTGSHQLISTLDLGDPVDSHLRSVIDSTPRSPSGVPDFAPTWTWMLQQVFH